VTQYPICWTCNAKKVAVCFRKHAPKSQGRYVGLLKLFIIQFHSHVCMLYMVLYRGWHQINMYEVYKCFGANTSAVILSKRELKFGTARNHQSQKDGRKHIIYVK